MAQVVVFFISRNLIVTNYHVIKNEKSDLVFFKEQNGKTGTAIIGLIDEKNDLALLRSFSNHGQALKLGDSSKVQLADDVIIVGSPLGLQGTVSKGIVSAKRKNFEGFEDIMQTSAPISSGSSGSPVLLKDTHEVIGVAVMIHREGQNLNFFIPINKLKNLMRTNKSKMNNLTKNLGKQYWESAKSGDKKAQALLGFSLYHGINWNKDYKKSEYWFLKTGDARFYIDLAYMYLKGGFGLKKDYRKARMYASCSLESYEKSKLLGFMYRDGIGFTVDKDKALSHFLKAIKQGDLSSCEFAGKLFLEERNFLRAFYWLSYARIYTPKEREKIVKELWNQVFSKLTQSQAVLILSSVLQKEYPTISQNTVFVTSPPCTSSDFKPQIAQFIEAAKRGNFLKISKMIKAGADVNTRDIDGITALMWAARFDKLDIVKALIKAGADVNLKDNMEWTALIGAARNGHTEIVKMLIKAGAKVNPKDLTLTKNEDIKKALRKALNNKRKNPGIGGIKTEGRGEGNIKGFGQKALDGNVRRDEESPGDFTSEEIEEIFKETEMQE